MNLKGLTLRILGIFTIISVIMVLLSMSVAIKFYERSGNAKAWINRLQIADQIQIQLLRTNREWLLYGATGQEEHRQTYLTEEDSIKMSLNTLLANPTTDEEKKIIELLKSSALEYLAIRDDLAKQNIPPLDSYQKANPYLRKAYENAALLAQLNLNNFKQAADHTHRTSAFMFLIALGILVATFFLFPLAGWQIRKWVYGPILNFKNQISAFRESASPKIVELEGLTEIQDVAKAYNELTNKLDEQKKARFRFLAGVAHDLKNPLGAIKMSTELMNTEDVSTEERLEMTQIISRQTDQLTRMVGDFLDASRIESGQLELKKDTCDLRALVHDSVLLHQKISGRHQIKLLSPAQAVASQCDPMRITQVINNLLSNAIKYSPNGGEIKVKISAEGDEAVIRVMDEGIGIGPEDQDKIFEPFQRTKITKETIPGVGLGLSVSKHIIERHQGSITIDSQIGKGTTFIVKLPLIKDFSFEATSHTTPNISL